MLRLSVVELKENSSIKTLALLTKERRTLALRRHVLKRVQVEHLWLKRHTMSPESFEKSIIGSPSLRHA